MPNIKKPHKRPLSLDDKKRQILEMLAVDRHLLLVKMPFIGSVLLRLELTPVSDERLPTAATNGESVFVDVDFYAKLNREERLFVLAHEAWHCVLLHFIRRQNRDPMRFNCAADLEIHFILTDAGLKAPFVLKHNPQWRGLSAEEIYELYKKRTRRTPMQESAHIKNIRPGGGFDTHCDFGTNPSLPNKTARTDADYQPEVKAETIERCRERVTLIRQQIQQTHGMLPQGLEILLDNIYKPEINWKELLAQFVTSCYGGTRHWLPPNRRYVWKGLYMQSAKQQRLQAIVAVDTSGSTEPFLPIFFSELSSLIKSFGSYDLTVIQCDEKIQSVEFFSDVKPMQDNQKWKVHGLGGTSFIPVFEYVKNHSELSPDLLIYLTDGFGESPKYAPPYPVLWLLTPDGENSATWGYEAVFNDKN